MIRKLENKDAEYMLEWMKDKDINCNFKTKFSDFSKQEVMNFIYNSYDSDNKHFAIINEDDEYQGTISLKNINNIDRNAEYSIVLRKSAIGNGVGRKATGDILRFAFEELKLHKVYLNVLSENIRAIKFYEKMNFKYEGEFKEHFFINGEFKDVKWFSIFKNKFGVKK